MTSGTGNTSSRFPTGGFERIRAQMAYLLENNYRVGLMYVRRRVNGEGSSSSIPELTETSNQFLATFQVIL